MEKSNRDLNWNDNSTCVLINPRMNPLERQRVEGVLSSNKVPSGLVWFSTSGSRAPKWIGLSREALLASAKAVNSHLKSTEKDIWIQPLPDFHVGGTGIFARAHLSGSRVFVLDKWLPHAFHTMVESAQATLSALVPAQVHDLVSAKLNAPHTLRAVVVGGGALPHDLYVKARQLGWPLLPSYGMTECGSQIATAPLSSLEKNDFPDMVLLPHITARINDHDFLEVKSPSLMTCSVSIQTPPHVSYPIMDGWYLSDDKAYLEENKLIVLGRGDDFIKIGGESVSIGHLESVWHNACVHSGVTADTAIVPQPDERLGKAIHLFTTNMEETKDAVDFYNSKVMPFEKIRGQHQVDEIPRSALGKIIKSELRKECSLVSF